MSSASSGDTSDGFGCALPWSVVDSMQVDIRVVVHDIGRHICAGVDA